MKIVDHPSINHILEVLTNYLNQAGVPYVIIGGVAVIVFGYIRATQDIDLIVDHEALDIKEFCKYLRQHQFLADEQDLFAAIKKKAHATILHRQHLFRLDVKGSYTTADRETMRTAITVNYRDIPIRLTSPESLICHKLLFTSARDFEDALAVYQRMKPTLKPEELERLSVLVGVEKLLRDLVTVAEQSIREQQDWVRKHLHDS